MRFVIALLVILGTQISFSQVYTIRKHKVDSLTLQLEADSLHTFRFKKLRPYGNIDNRNSFYKPANFTGFQLGLIVNEYHTLGIGFYRLNQAPRASLRGSKEGYRLRNLNYNTIFYEYLLVNKKFFEVDLPFEIGYGEYYARYTDTASIYFSQNFLNVFIPLSAGVKFIAKPVRWIGLSLMVGYRYLLEDKRVLDFNGFYFPVGIWVDLRQVYRDIKFYGFQKKRYNREVKKVLEN